MFGEIFISALLFGFTLVSLVAWIAVCIAEKSMGGITKLLSNCGNRTTERTIATISFFWMIPVTAYIAYFVGSHL